MESPDRKPLRWGILGTAEIATSVVRGIGMGTEGVVQAVASRDLERARSWADKYKIPLAFGSYDEMLSSGEVDLIYNPLPNSLHAKWTIRALEAGLPVLCEKPFTADATQAREVTEVSKRTNLPVAEAFMYRHHPVYERILDLVRKGEIGDLTTIHSRFTFPMDDWSENPASAKMGGGALRDVGCYCVDLARQVTGSEPVRVYAMARAEAVDYTMVGMMEFPGKILAQFECSIESQEHYGAEIIGTKGSILLENPWFPGEESASFVLCQGENKQVVETAGGDGYHLEAEDFARAWRTRTPPKWEARDAVAGMKVVDALTKSAQTGEVCIP